jgi:membrane protein DedA with SNARE-associated domain/rhodanese-related sulfurtransferase
MQHIIAIAERHGLLIVFVNVLLARGGLPLPIVPTLMTAAALAGQSAYQIAGIVVAGVGGTLIAELALYWCGLRYGRRFLGLLCRMSFSPDFCVRQTETMFAKVGPWSLLFAKFVPGLSLIAVAMAGITQMSVLVFLLLDGIGSLAFVSAVVALGLIFRNAIASVVATLADFGVFGALIVVAAIALYLLIKWWQRRLFIRQLRMDRITVDELRSLMDDGRDVVILDVRPKEVRSQDGIIPGAVAAHPADIDPVVRNYSRDAEIVVYCACPNEESAATAAKHLKRAGFKKIRPLLGGIEAWVKAGHPIERAKLAEDDAQGWPAPERRLYG